MDVEKIARIRREIAAGTYETPEKLDAAFDAMLDCWDASDDDDSERSSAAPPRSAK
jgi:hypothetical protein